MKTFGVDPMFGKCPFHSSTPPCGALLFPIEVKPFLPPELYEKYFIAFNRIYRERKKLGELGYVLEGKPKAIGGAGTGEH